MVDSPTPEIGITNIYGGGNSVINVSSAGGAVHPVLSPNGVAVAFSWNCTIYTVNRDGAGLAPLPNATGACAENPAWSPNSSQLAFDAYSQTNAGTWVTNLDGSHQVEIAGGFDPSWSPNGTRIALVEVTDRYAIETVPATGGPGTVLVSTPAGIDTTLTSPAWSPDGSTIAYGTGALGGPLPAGGSLSLIDADGADDHNIGNLPGSGDGALGLSWCPNSQCLLSEFGAKGTSSSTTLAILETNGTITSSLTLNGNDASFAGVQGVTPPGAPVPQPTIGAASTASGEGFWTAGADGGIFTYGDAQFYGSMGGRPLDEPVVGMAATPDGEGYREVASDGGIFAFGDAKFYGSMGGRALNQPVVGMATDPSTGGYWEVASDGGIFSFDAPFFGSTGGIRLNQPVVGMAATSDGGGYWLVAADGGVFAYGDATFRGSMGGDHLNAPVTAMAPAPGGGYWLVAADGGVFSFGSATFQGSTGGLSLAQPVISLVPSSPTNGYREVTAGGGQFSFSAPLA